MRIKIGIILTTIAAIIAAILPMAGVSAATSAGISVTATGQSIVISCNQSTYAFGDVAASSTPSTTTSWATVTNTSNVAIDVSIGSAGTWTSVGSGWTWSNTATAGANTAGMLSNAGGTWGVSDVIIKSSSLLNIETNLAANTNFNFGLKLIAPTSFTDTDANSNTITITASAH